MEVVTVEMIKLMDFFFFFFLSFYDMMILCGQIIRGRLDWEIGGD